MKKLIENSAQNVKKKRVCESFLSHKKQFRFLYSDKMDINIYTAESVLSKEA